MISRNIDSFIDKHFAESRKALLLTGARQVGKTFAIRQYAKRNKLQLIELNFLLQPETINIVKGANDVKDLLLRISAYVKSPMQKGKCLLFFDEVQHYPDVLTWVKAIVDEGNFMCALSGSLLGLELRNVRSVPVGYMVEKQMFPLDFCEFLKAVGVQDDVIGAVRYSYDKQVPVDDFLHQQILQLFNLYLIVGGMPAAVQTYLDTNDLQRVLQEQQAVLSLYKRDISTYDPEDKLYINDIFDLIPSELNAKNKRFVLKKLNEHLKFSRHENSFVWLRDADMALPAYNVQAPQSPLKLNEQRNLFKLFQNDVGLLASQYVGGIQLKILQGDININYGAIYENVVAQELHAHGWNLYYFSSKKQGEIDFLLERNGEILPVEVKSGKDYQRHVALNNLLSTEEYKINNAIVLCNANVTVRQNITYLPIYMTMFLHYNENAGSIIYRPVIPKI